MIIRVAKKMQLTKFKEKRNALKNICPLENGKSLTIINASHKASKNHNSLKTHSLLLIAKMQDSHFNNDK